MSMLNDASRSRLALAGKVADAYARQRGVVAIIVGGSVARGWADRWSDVEIGVFWDRLPTERELVVLAAGAGLEQRQVFDDLLPGDGLDEEGVVGGLKVDLYHRTVEATERAIRDVIEDHQSDWSKQAQVAAIRSGIALHGGDRIDAWRHRSVYPDGLARAMVERHLAFGPHAWLEMLAERDDALYLYTFCCEAERRILGTLLGVNRTYPPSSETKWMRQVAQELRVAPHDLTNRLALVFRSDPVIGVRELGRLIEETIALVEEGMPGIDTAPVRRRVAQRRPMWE